MPVFLDCPKSQIRTPPKITFVDLFWIIVVNLSNFLQNSHGIWQTLLQNPYIIFESQLGIPISNMQGLYFSSQTTPCWFSPNFMQFVQFHNEYSTSGSLWEGNFLFEIGNRDMETSVSKGLFTLSSSFFTIWTQSSHGMGKVRLHTLCIIFESPLGIIIPKIQYLCFASQGTYLRFSPIYMHLFQCLI